jgi:soluble lytic murein transglycosylase-like protein
MKKRIVLLAIFTILFSFRSIAPNANSWPIERPMPINPYESLLMAMIQVESAGDSMAFNPVEEAYGILQIRPIRILDYYRRTGKKYTMQDCYSPKISTEIFMYYASRLGPGYEIIARKWNGSGVKTTEYWDRVKKMLARTDT